MPMISAYGFCAFLSIVAYIWLYVTDVKKSLCQNIMLLIMTFSNVGFLCLSLSRNLETAILSNKIIYLGGCFLPLLYFFTVCEVCHIDLKKKITVPLILVQLAIFGCVCTIGYTRLYYKEVHFVIENGIAHLVKRYGPTHFLYPLTMYGYFVASMSITVWSVLKKKMIDYKGIRNMLICSGLSTLYNLIQKVAGLKIDMMPLAFMLLIVGALIPIYRSNIYTVNENKDVIREQLSKVGFITFNKKMEYMGCNDYAVKVFKELENYKVGNVINHAGEELNELIMAIREYDVNLEKTGRIGHKHKKMKTFKMNDRSFDCEIHTVNNYAKRCVGYTIELRDGTEHYRMMELKERYNEELTQEVNDKTKKIRTIQERTILGMAQMVESRDLSTGGHIKRTSDVVRIFSKKLLKSDLGLEERFLNLVVRSAPMHDLGKIGVDDAILRKQGKFTEKEYAQMKTHTEIGGKMVTDILTGVEEEEFVEIAHNVANYHHEKINGKGYPEGLKGEEIPIEARIMALADVFDALVSKRCYKEAFSYEKAFLIIKEDAGTHFDYELAMLFLECRTELEAYYNNYAE